METLYIWALGFLLGIKHSLDTDHVIAVSAIISRYKNPWRSALAGVFWGIGHTSTLLIVALFILVFRPAVPPSAERLAELIVGLALTWLGVSVIRQSVARRLHVHRHNHGNQLHLHFHTHDDTDAHDHRHGRSVLIGMAHGLAGSAALVLLVLAEVKSIGAGIIYILVFGAGSILGMLIFGGLVGIPIAATANAPKANLSLRLVTGFASLGLGLFTIAQNWPKVL